MSGKRKRERERQRAVEPVEVAEASTADAGADAEVLAAQRLERVFLLTRREIMGSDADALMKIREPVLHFSWHEAERFFLWLNRAAEQGRRAGVEEFVVAGDLTPSA